MIRCTRCGVEKDAANFTKREKRCRDCRALIARERWQRIQADPERYEAERKKRHQYYRDNKQRWVELSANRQPLDPVIARERRLRREYGITGEQYDAMHAAQGGVCAICRCPETIEGRPLAVDHCHASGNVRSLLCSRCNTAIGLFDDDGALMRVAAAYVEAHAA